MSFCTECGVALQARWRFCPQCGTQAERPPDDELISKPISGIKALPPDPGAIDSLTLPAPRRGLRSELAPDTSGASSTHPASQPSVESRTNSTDRQAPSDSQWLSTAAEWAVTLPCLALVAYLLQRGCASL